VLRLDPELFRSHCEHSARRFAMPGAKAWEPRPNRGFNGSRPALRNLSPLPKVDNRGLAVARKRVKFRLRLATVEGAMLFTRSVNPPTFFSHRIAACARVAACLVAVVMLLSLPALRSHTFSTHFRSPEVRRSMARHTSVSPIHAEAKLQLCASEIEPVVAIQAQRQTPLQNHEGETIARASIVETLHRMKLGPHSEADSEPHLQ
jgi:hypothetical protein